MFLLLCRSFWTWDVWTRKKYSFLFSSRCFHFLNLHFSSFVVLVFNDHVFEEKIKKKSWLDTKLEISYLILSFFLSFPGYQKSTFFVLFPPVLFFKRPNFTLLVMSHKTNVLFFFLSFTFRIFYHKSMFVCRLILFLD